MAANETGGMPPSTDWRGREKAFRRFEDAWQRGERPALDDYLPPPGPNRVPVLGELAHVDLEYRLKAGDPARVEDYLRRYPELAGDRAAVLQLVRAEWDLRRRHEPQLALAEYAARFPECREELQGGTPTGPDAARTGLNSTLATTPEPGPGARAAGPTPADLPSVPGYELLGTLGRGGMGVVYQARQVALKRLVALKMILAGPHAGAEQLARFRREAEAVARLQHPNIVQIHDVGEQHGQPYFSLEFVDGGSLDRNLAGRPQPAQPAARLVAVLARAVHYAHERGVVHRDLKPANVLLAADGTPKITDFGLAKRLDGASAHTQSGAVMGTPSYMAPEQAEGRTHEVGPAADTYALGAILYELLTGRPPFRGDSAWDTVRQVLTQDPVPPSRLQSKVHRDVETVCLKALAKEPGRRYASALALARDLERFAAGEPIEGRREGPVSRAWRRVRRNPVPAVAALLLVAAAAAGYFALRARDSGRTAAVHALEARVAAGECTPEFLDETDRQLEDLARQEPEAAAAIRRRLYARFGEFVRAAIHKPRIDDKDAAGIGGLITHLDGRAGDLAAALRTELRDRLTAWQVRFELQPPFDRQGPAALRDAFDPPHARAEGRGLVRRTPAGGKGDPVIHLRADSVGDVKLEAEFDRTTWRPGDVLGLVLNGRAATHYAFLLDRGRPAPGHPDFLRLRIVRNGVRVAEQRLHLESVAAQRLRLTAQREQDRLSIQVNDLPPLAFRDVFPPAGGDVGVCGIHWPEGVVLLRLAVSRRALPARPSPLEKGDELYARGQLDGALRVYQGQAETARDPAVVQEATYKRGLCLVGRNRREEARDLFETLSREGGTVWPPRAACQLWLLLYEARQLDKAERVFQGLQMHYRFEELVSLVPFETRKRILTAYLPTGGNWLLFNPTTLANCRKAVDALDYLAEDDVDGRFWARHALCRAYWMAGQPKQALTVAEELTGFVQKIGGAQRQHCFRIAFEEYGWLLRRQGEAKRALEAIDHILKAGEPAPVLLVERARVHAALGDLDQAEKDVKEYLRQSAAAGDPDYHGFAAANLLLGFFRDGKGDAKGAQEAWGRGVYRAWRRRHPDYPTDLPVGPMNAPGDFFGGHALILYHGIMASLTDQLTEQEVEALVARGLKAFSPRMPWFMSPKLIGVSPTAVARQMWRSRVGKEWARRFALRDLSFPESLRCPFVVAAVEIARQHVTGKELTEDQARLLEQLVEDGQTALAAGKFGQPSLRGLVPYLFPMLTAWNGGIGKKDWEQFRKLARPYPSLRGPLAYFAGHRYLFLKKPGWPRTFFTLARDDAARAPANPLLRRLAEAELKRLPP